MSIEEEIVKQRKRADFNRSMYGISVIKENNKRYLEEAEECEQVADWLEELSRLRIEHGATEEK